MKAIIYTRVSSEKQADDGTSLGSQADACRRYASDNDLTVIDTIQDVYSGAYLHERPGLNRRRDGVRSGYYKVVISYATDRLSRSVAHLMILLDECERYGVELRFVTEPKEELGTYIGDMLANLMHCCDTYDEDFNDCLDRARMHYRDEVFEEQHES